jgi:hypothetical protein
MCQPMVPPPADVISLSGPRVGFTVLSQSIVDTLKKEDQIIVSPLISQFGWQFEKLNVPVNFAVVPTKAGTRVSVLTGFSLRQR